MAGLSTYAAQRVFDLLLNPSTRERPTYLALHRGVVDDASYGNEANYGGYTRQDLNSMYASFVAGADGEVTLVAKNGGKLMFQGSGGPQNTLTHWAIWDSPNRQEGNVLFSGSLVAQRAIDVGDAPVVHPNEITIYFI